MDNEKQNDQESAEEASAEESIPISSAVFFGEPQPDFWDENFF